MATTSRHSDGAWRATGARPTAGPVPTVSVAALDASGTNATRIDR